MKFAFSNRRHRIGAACRSLALAAAMISVGSVAHATDYDEAVSGDLSSDPAHPTMIGSLTLGGNAISGATIPSGPLDPVTHSRPVVDNDYFSFTVPTGDALAKIVIDPSTAIEPGDRLFFGISNGTDVHVDPSFSSPPVFSVGPWSARPRSGKTFSQISAFPRQPTFRP